MPNPELEQYIKDSLAEGMPREEISKALLDAGWKKQDIEETFSKLMPEKQTTEKQITSSRVVPKVPRKKIIPFIVIGSFLVAGISVAGFFAYRSFIAPQETPSELETTKEIKETLTIVEEQPQAPSVLTVKSGRLKVAHITRQYDQETLVRQESIVTIDLISGQESTIFTPETDTRLANLAWYESKKKIAFTMCCGEEVSGTWTTDVDGADLQRISENDLYSIKSSPDGSMLSYRLRTGSNTTDAIKVIDIETNSELIHFNAPEEKQGIISNYFWMPDGKSIIVNGLVSNEKSEAPSLAIESWQISIDDGSIIRTFNNNISGVLNSQIVYSKDALSDYIAYGGAGVEDLNMFISDINGENERTLFSFSDDKYCQKNYVIGGTYPLIVDNKIAFVVGGNETSPECAGRRAVILDLETEETVYTDPFISNLRWSPEDSKFLAVTVTTRVYSTGGATIEIVSSGGWDEIDLYTPDGKFAKTVITGCPDGCREKWIFFYDDAELAFTDEELGQIYGGNVSTEQLGNDLKRLGDMRGMQLVLESYFDVEGNYPVQTICGPMPSNIVEKGIIPKLPEDPSGPSWPYQYASNADGTNYVIRADLEYANQSSLAEDVDGLVLTCDCNDTDGYLCLQP